MIEINQYLINTENDIINLKIDLMTEDTKNTEGNKSSNVINLDKSSIHSEVRQIMNTDLGIIFEENIRGTLKYEYGLDESLFPRNVIYRKVIIGETPNIILNCMNKKKINNNKSFSFTININNSITITEPKKQSKKYIFNDNKEMITSYINNENISIYHHNEIEVDGIFIIKKKFKVNMFGDEVKIIFNNVNKNEEKTLNFAVL